MPRVVLTRAACLVDHLRQNTFKLVIYMSLSLLPITTFLDGTVQSSMPCKASPVVLTIRSSGNLQFSIPYLITESPEPLVSTF